MFHCICVCDELLIKTKINNSDLCCLVAPFLSQKKDKKETKDKEMIKDK